MRRASSGLGVRCTTVRWMQRRWMLFAAILSAALFAAGCGDSDQRTDADDAAKRLAVDDLRPLVTLSPERDRLGWDVKPQTRLRRHRRQNSTKQSPAMRSKRLSRTPTRTPDS